MTEYRCPPAIAANLVTEELAAAKGRNEFLEWMRTLCVRRGDLVEFIDVGGESKWLIYEPRN